VGALVVVTALALVAIGVAPARAQSTPETPPTTSPVEGLLSNLLGGGTVPPPPPAGSTPADPGSVPANADSGTGQDPGVGSDAPPAGDQTVPPEAQAAIDSINRTPGRNTSELLVALRQLIDLGLSAEEAAVIGMGHFPIAGQADYTDDFLFPRFNPDFRPHQGNDIFATEGTPVRASEDGTVRFTEGGISGKAYYLTVGGGTYYFGCHLSAFADLPSGSSVTKGQIIGFVGTTGDAAGGAPHLHFEVHPGGGGAIDPKATLDGWIDEALANIAGLVATYRQVGMPRAITFAGMLRRFDEPLAGGNGIPTLLNASASDSAIQRLSELRASRAGTADGAQADPAVSDAWKTADRASRSLLAPVTPLALQRVLVRESG